MNNSILRNWVETNIYPRVSPGFKWAVWAVIFAVFFGLAGHYDHQSLLAGYIH